MSFYRYDLRVSLWLLEREMEATAFLEYGELNVDFMTETEPFISDVTKLK